MAPLPPEGTLTFVGSAEEAATGVDFVQESAPERMDLKRSVLAAAASAAGPDVVIASSTSGLRPSELQEGMLHPQRLVVGHPFNPVYLLPLVEVVGGAATSGAAVDRAAEVYRSVGMQPLVLSTEIDGFVADRLLEALWREALWLVHDGVATVEEIDDAIRFGAGLRWSFMGTFLTYRIAGGEAGMRHFMAQFGPALQWPWTKLVDVPELTDDLLDRLVAQSDAQAAGRSVRELEAERDDCLVAVLQALRSVGVGAGAVVDRYERTLFGRAEPDEQELQRRPAPHPGRADRPDRVGRLQRPHQRQPLPGAVQPRRRRLHAPHRRRRGLPDGRPLLLHRREPPHLRRPEPGRRPRPGRARCSSPRREALPRLHVDRPARGRRLDTLIGTAEHLLLHVDTVANRAVPADAAVLDRLAAVAAAHAGIARPAAAGRHVGQPR